jgi:translation initiation factor 1
MGEEERKLKTKDRVLVYSDDPKDQAKMSGETDRIAIESLHKKLINDKKFVIVFRIEKNGRGGKTVTVLDQLPAYEPFLKDLTKELKAKCGVGGSFFVEENKGCIEIQGDKRDAIKKILDQKNLKYKGV